jgi:hypothetical protein
VSVVHLRIWMSGVMGELRVYRKKGKEKALPQRALK